MFKFVHAADAHLDSPLRGLERYEGAPVDEIRSATRRAFENLVALAIEEKVSFVLLAGDLYDGDWKDYNTGLFFVAQMRRLEKAGISALLVSGNHDAASRITRALRPPANVHAFPTARAGSYLLDELGVAVHGRGFARRAVTENLAASFPRAEPDRFNIGLLHTSLDGRPGHDSYAPCSLDDLREKGYDYWALGHIHRRETVCEDPWVVFPGNLQGRHSRETGAKGCTVVRVEDREVVEVEQRELDVLRWAHREVDVKTALDADDALDQAVEALHEEMDGCDGRPLAVRLILTGSTEAHRELASRPEHWNQELRARASGPVGGEIWLELVRFATRPPVERASKASRDDALGGLLGSLESLREGSDRMAELAAKLGPLRRKLPAELMEGPEGVDPTDPEALVARIPAVRELLLDRLTRVEPSGDDP